MDKYLVSDIDLFLFDLNTQTTLSGDLSTEMKTYYSDYLIDNAKPFLVHDQWAQTHNIPANGGKTIEFRKYTPFAKALTPLTEGVTPDGHALAVTNLTATVAQYGDYVTLSDVLMLTAIDNNLVQATELLGQQAGETLDTITREVLNGGTNVQYQDDAVIARYLLVGGETSGNHYLTVNCMNRAQRTMKFNKAQTPAGRDYVAVIHPDVAYDLKKDTDWEDWHKYATPETMFNGEIGRLHGIRFVETTEAKIFHAADLSAAARTLTVSSFLTKTITISETLTAADQAALVGRSIIVAAASTYADPMKYTVASATANTIVINETPTHNPASTDIIYAGEAGAKGRDVYSTLVIGKNAYGTTSVEGGGLTFIVKQLGSAGTGDPLNQRATTGWKAIKTAKILVDAFLLRIETCSSYASGAN